MINTEQAVRERRKSRLWPVSEREKDQIKKLGRPR